MTKKIALITGATSGIGRATALKLASLGYNLIICGRRSDRLIEVSDELAGLGASILAKVVDVRNRKEVESFISGLSKEWHAIDVLINNAGLAAGLSTFYEGDIDDWEQMIDTNINGLLYVSRFVSPGMVSRKKGYIINIGSIAGKEVYPNGNVYCATKHAVDALSKAMRRELAEHKIRVTAIHPGAVETEFSLVRFKGDTNKAAAVYKGFENLVADDIAEAIVWCVNRPEHVNINEMTIMPTAQPVASVIFRDS